MALLSVTAACILFPLLLWCLSSLHGLYRNYRVARQVGLPVLIIPVSPENPVWMLLSRHLIPLFNRIPFGTGTFTRFCRLGWEYYEKNSVVADFGDALLLCTPGRNWIYLWNAETMSDILQRRNEFPRPVELLAMLDVFGPNISTVDGPDWQRQRKATAATFTEANNSIVWHESIHQAEGMLEYWKTTQNGVTQTMAKDVRTLALNVLLCAGFGKSFPFHGSHEDQRPAATNMSHRDALALILENAILILALGRQFLKVIPFPKTWARVGQAAVVYQQYLEQALRDERVLIDQGNSGSGPLITSLVRTSSSDSDLRDEEIFGNMFVYQFAGHDTTSHTLAYTLMHLAAYPHVQEWMTEELDHLLPSGDNRTWRYDAVFPSLKRTLSVLLETVRLFDPLLSIVKSTGARSATLTLNDTPIVVPRDTRVILNINALHSNPRYWNSTSSDDLLTWRPSRWIQTAPAASNSASGSVFDRESLVIPPKGAYIPFSGGARECPGKKFAQVEHVAVMATIFSKYRILPLPKNGEDQAAAQERTKGVIADTAMLLLLQMLHPHRIALKVVRR